MRPIIGVSVSVAIVTAMGALATAQEPSSAGGGARAAAAATVTLKEFTLVPSPSSVHRGRVTFTVRNRGHLTHEFVVIRTRTRASKLPVSGKRASERGAIGEIGSVGPGKTKRLTVSLKAGHYALICNLRGHYRAGQFADFNVR